MVLAGTEGNRPRVVDTGRFAWQSGHALGSVFEVLTFLEHDFAFYR
jgi:hypothetical protein